MLSRYELDYHPILHQDSTTQRMAKAKGKDTSSPTYLNSWMEKFQVRKDRPRFYDRVLMMIASQLNKNLSLLSGFLSTSPFLIKAPSCVHVRFNHSRSLMAFDPYAMPEVLTRHPTLSEVLWNFSRLMGGKRLTLLQNPHFYGMLPRSPRVNWSTFRADPIDSFRYKSISVLVDKPHWIYLETPIRRRALSNVWLLGDAMVFKGLSLCVIPLSPSLTRTSSQTRAEGSRVKISSERRLWTRPSYGTERNLCHLLPACRRVHPGRFKAVYHLPCLRSQQIPQCGYQSRTGETQFSECCNPRMLITIYASRLNPRAVPAPNSRFPVSPSGTIRIIHHGVLPNTGHS